MDSREERNCKSFFRLRELYVRRTLEDINFDAREVGARCGASRRRDASLWLCLAFTVTHICHCRREKWEIHCVIEIQDRAIKMIKLRFDDAPVTITYENRLSALCCHGTRARIHACLNAIYRYTTVTVT